MLDGATLFVAAVFALAGFVKGVIGLGLPTIAMGLLAIALTPIQAAAILLLPSFLTNVWQMLAGPALGALLRRLWPMLAAVCIGTWAGIGLMTGLAARYGAAALGACLVLYALLGLTATQLSLARSREGWLGPIAGAVTGAITAATGVFVIPAVPYLQAIGLEKEELVQALGLSFTVSTLALAVNVAQAGALDAATAGSTAIALIAAFAGMGAGQMLRSRLSPATFRRWFFIGLAVLGAYLVVRAVR